jgi:hypothetical protein
MSGPAVSTAPAHSYKAATDILSGQASRPAACR